MRSTDCTLPHAPTPRTLEGMRQPRDASHAGDEIYIAPEVVCCTREWCSIPVALLPRLFRRALVAEATFRVCLPCPATSLPQVKLQNPQLIRYYSMRVSCQHSRAVLHPARGYTRLARDVRQQASFGDKLRDIWEKWQFENWAPKSSRVWRLRQYPSEVGSKQEAQGAPGPTIFLSQCSHATSQLN